MLLRCCTLACLLGFSIVTAAQMMPHPAPVTLQINGQVRYAQGGRPAEFVLVRLEAFGSGVVGDATTDRDGKFRFAGLAGALYVVSVRVPGYKETQQQVDLRTQVTDYIQLQLMSDSSFSNSSSSTTRKSGVVNAKVPSNALAEFEKGRDALLQAKNPAEAIAHLERAVQIYPNYSEALLLLGAAYIDRREWAKAETALRQVLTLESKATAAHLALGELYLDQKNYSVAEKELLAGITLDSKSSRGHLILGRLYYELGDLPKAGTQVGTALRLDPRLARGHLLAGNILLRARQPDNALVEFQEYLRLEPSGEFSEAAKQTVRQIKAALGKS